MEKRNFIRFIFHFGETKFHSVYISFRVSYKQPLRLCSRPILITEMTNIKKHFMPLWERALIFRNAHNSVVSTKVRCVSENQCPVKNYLFLQTKKAL